MNATQKHAWFNLVVVAVTVVVLLALLRPFGARALGAFGLLGLLGLGPGFFRRRRGEVVIDERDRAIVRRAGLIAYGVFWVAFVVVCVSLPLLYGWDGSVPVVAAQSAVWVALMLLIAARSLTTLVLYQMRGPDVT